MRTILCVIAILLVPAHLFAAEFTRALTFGMHGEDVRTLQQFLNTDSETRVAKTGAGSPGNETDYFGHATERAVIKFQEKYSAEILAPLGLMQGTGFFGEKTRAKALAIIKAESTSSANTWEISVSASSTISSLQTATTSAATELNDPIPWTSDMVVPEGVNPNSINLEYTISEMKKIGKIQGASDSELTTAERAMREAAATSTDLTREFFKTITIKYVDAQFLNTHFKLAKESIVGKILVTLGIAKVAYAAAPLPFGGKVVGAIPCTCSPGVVWLVTLTPLPPTYATVLSYISGTQLFATYVPTPHTAQSFLGFYIATIYPISACLMLAPIPADPCVPSPSWGTISPEVGSSI